MEVGYILNTQTQLMITHYTGKILIAQHSTHAFHLLEIEMIQENAILLYYNTTSHLCLCLDTKWRGKHAIYRGGMRWSV